jgi:calcineurin-like phosphoesterase family protein
MAPRLPFYIISDTHFYHENIVKYAGRPYDHEVMMINRWEKVVPKDATIVHLGDLFFGGDEGFLNFFTYITPRLTGKKYLVLGNHDKRSRDYETLGFEVIKPFSVRYRGYEVSFDHYPKLLPEGEKKIHVHGHIHNHTYARDEPKREGNVNVSVEVMDYRPHRMTRLLNKHIRHRNQQQRYTNSRHVRTHKALRNRRNVVR